MSKKAIQAYYLANKVYEHKCNEIITIYRTKFEQFGVPMPKKMNLSMLVYLYINLGTPVDLEELRDYMAYFHPGTSSDKQPRHLRTLGWDVRSGKSRRTDVDNNGNDIPKGHIMLASLSYRFLKHSPMDFKYKIYDQLKSDLGIK